MHAKVTFYHEKFDFVLYFRTLASAESFSRVFNRHMMFYPCRVEPVMFISMEIEDDIILHEFSPDLVRSYVEMTEYMILPPNHTPDEELVYDENSFVNDEYEQ